MDKGRIRKRNVRNTSKKDEMKEKGKLIHCKERIMKV